MASRCAGWRRSQLVVKGFYKFADNPISVITFREWRRRAMQVNSVSGVLPTVASSPSSKTPKPAKPAAAPAAQAASASSPQAAQSSSAPPPPAAQTTSTPPASASTSPTKSATGAPPIQSASAQAASAAAASAAAANLVSQTYTTTVAGKNYSASIQESNGEYVLSVPNLPGATAPAESAQAAENALNIKIDVLA